MAASWKRTQGEHGTGDAGWRTQDSLKKNSEGFYGYQTILE
ncbi:hypothetical protein BRYFOR_08035 [Marvinbryantia formatexigens DSM 14469]|uniref:Uncharacterized protein n=1 Tax=Marvinbryantia formatexigens DSM 14469 TaxID=478749 RepID=C6LHC4_9FIRM|nr:hypothetical protein BRYFOR_08035 [Marvinbryantia formatexigens DSM 14469]